AAEAVEIIEKVEQFDNFLKTLPVVGALYEQFVSKQLWDKVDLIGKILKFVLSLGLINLIAQILGAIMLLLSAIKFAGWATGVLSAIGGKLAEAWGGVKSWLSGAWNSLGKTADSLLRPVGQAATALNTVAGTVPGGAAIGYTTVGIIAGAALWQTLIFGPFLTNRPLSGSGGELTIDILEGYEGCWPTSGSINGYKSYSDGGKHRVWSGGSVPGFPSYNTSGSAIDITTGAAGFNTVRTPFAGTASFYPEGTGVLGGASFKNGSIEGNGPYGNHVIVTTDKYLLIFAHLKSFGNAASDTSPTENVSVSAGQLIGIVDSTGNSTGNHLHYEVVGKSGFKIDILSLLPLSRIMKEQIIRDESDIYGIYVNADTCSSSAGGSPLQETTAEDKGNNSGSENKQ
ncbi:MAG TPA: peptidoglycan DD-metalloendopeptidase family protein, partial [Patescibacteria group bacterium]|nr:peptidoglycan DD-metalloendopeptidase family protein [Patescibacteria group bacterium]